MQMLRPPHVPVWGGGRMLARDLPAVNRGARTTDPEFPDPPLKPDLLPPSSGTPVIAASANKPSSADETDLSQKNTASGMDPMTTVRFVKVSGESGKSPEKYSQPPGSEGPQATISSEKRSRTRIDVTASPQEMRALVRFAPQQNLLAKEASLRTPQIPTPSKDPRPAEGGNEAAAQESCAPPQPGFQNARAKAIPKSTHSASLNATFEMHRPSEPHEKSDRATKHLHEVIPLFPLMDTCPRKTAKLEDRPHGNSIHIGSVDIHILPPPNPVSRPPVRQAAAGGASVWPSFVSSYGLRQG
jgi:hypothetical protein